MLTERWSEKPFDKVSTGQQPSMMLKSLLRNMYNTSFIAGKHISWLNITNHTSFLAFCNLGLDILGPFPKALGGFEFLFVAIDMFTK